MQIVANDRFRFRLRQVVEFLADNLATPPRLEDLADLAGMSPFHFLRVYAQHMGETPMATGRRLRLNNAWMLLAKGNRVADVAHAAGYGSSQAFSNAFHDRFGLPPSKVPKTYGLPALPPHFETIIHRPISAVPFRGTMADAVIAFDDLFKSLHRQGERVAINQVYAILADAPDLTLDRQLRAQAAVVSEHRVRGVDRAMLPSGTHIVVRTTSTWPEASPAEVDRILRAAHHAGYERTEGPMMARPVVDPYRTAPRDRVWEVLYPVRAKARS